MNAFDRNTNLVIISELRNLEKKSLNSYIVKVLMPLNEQNPTFCETLYKDIVYVLKDIDKEGDNDILIGDGDLVIEDGNIKLTGYQTSFHEVLVWLHQMVVKKIEEESKDFTEFESKITNFNAKFLANYNFTPEYTKSLDEIKKSMKTERRINYDGKVMSLKKIFDPDFLELKPNIMGIGINLNEIINMFLKK
jgi:hypothetical protein